MFFCKNCKSHLNYDERWDSYFCVVCEIWTEKKCDDLSCYFCSNRPEKPSEIDNDRSN